MSLTLSTPPSSPEDFVNLPGGYNDQNVGILPYGRTLTFCTGDTTDKLSFKSGELVQLLRHVDDYWIEGQIDGKVGCIPTKCIQIIVDCAKRNYDQIDGVSSTATVLPSDTYGRVLFDLQTQEEGNLDLRVGDTVTLLSQLNSDWYEVRTDNGSVGMCPVKLIEIIGAKSEMADHRPFSNSDSLQQLECSQVLTKDKVNSLNQDSVDGFCSFSGSSDGSSFYISNENDTSQDPFFSESEKQELRVLKTQISLPNLASNYYSQLSNERNGSFGVSMRHRNMLRHSAPTASASGIKDLSAESGERTPSLNSLMSMIVENSEKHLEIPEEDRLFGEDETDTKNRVIKLEQKMQEVSEEIGEIRKQHEIIKKTRVIDEMQMRAKRAEQLKEEYQQKRKEAQKKKKAEQRQCVILELLQSEKDYLEDIKLCHFVFSTDAEHAKNLGIHIVMLLGNLDEVIQTANEVLRQLQKCCNEQPAANQEIGKCFLAFGDEIKEVYGHYCRNYNEVVTLLDKYKSIPSMQDFIDQKIDEMNKETNCFDLLSVLVKPVQRVLKYPLLLNEINKCTKEDHIDKKPLSKAILLMGDVAMAINESKRRKDLDYLLVKYRQDADTSLSFRLSKLTFHSIRKKYNRIGVRLSSTFGFTNITRDEEFAKAEKKFYTLEKALKIFLKDITAFISLMQDLCYTILSLTESLEEIYQEQNLKELIQLCSIHRTIFTNYWEGYRQSMEKRVVGTLKEVLQAFSGPMNLIRKRNDKLLDYHAIEGKPKKNQSKSKICKEVQFSKDVYQTLNNQLIEELPQFCALSIEILHGIIRQFICSRKIFIESAAHEAWSLMKLPFIADYGGDLLNKFKVKHNLVVYNLLQLSIVPRSIISSKKMDAKNVLLKVKSLPFSVGSKYQPEHQTVSQNSEKMAFLTSGFPTKPLFIASDSFGGSDSLDQMTANDDRDTTEFDSANSLTPSSPPTQAYSPQRHSRTSTYSSERPTCQTLPYNMHSPNNSEHHSPPYYHTLSHSEHIPTNSELASPPSYSSVSFLYPKSSGFQNVTSSHHSKERPPRYSSQFESLLEQPSPQFPSPLTQQQLTMSDNPQYSGKLSTETLPKQSQRVFQRSSKQATLSSLNYRHSINFSSSSPIQHHDLPNQQDLRRNSAAFQSHQQSSYSLNSENFIEEV